MVSAGATARARARAELTREIKAEARRQLGRSGASELSLRAVARELGMVSSAVYRYFASRDELLTALIIDAYDAVGATAESAAGDEGDGVEARWLRTAGAIRSWAVEHPHDYALVYGSPVPGYEAPGDTVSAAMRVGVVALGIVADGVAAGEIWPGGGPPLPPALQPDLARLRDEVAPRVTDEVLARALYAWAQLFGMISLELFGHFHNVIDDYGAFFDHQMRRSAQVLVAGP
ncbi:MAG: TetR family transcriptional regulator [Acidimicrobiia bacterium]|nr:TetR family transcriptional regulator [Acidimicrobiia bacterium]